jgi:oxygen-independent coproporphyrinogen-3 oxidase
LTHIKAGIPAIVNYYFMWKLTPFAARNVPRYTSYPTAPHFSETTGPDDYARWLAELPVAATLSLYLHVPYCTELCLYCGCHTKITRKRDPIDRYADRLIDEIGFVGALAGRRPCVQLHWGGGTPSILGEAALARIAQKLADAFDLSALKEHAIELDPRRVTRPLARALASIGVNRASLGVQDFSPRVQQAIGRMQPFDVVERSVDLLREAGIARINIDLMYGLPRQTAREVLRSAALAASLQPQRLALFGYAHVPWFKKHQRLIDDADLPTASERLEQARVAAEVLVGLGYTAIGLDHFAKPGDELALAAQAGRLHRNFQGYTADDADALIGFGASAIGRLPQGFVQNAVDIGGYSRAVAAGCAATAKGIAFTADDILRGAIIERLMCDYAVDLAAVSSDIRAAARFAAEIESLAPLVREGFARIEGHRIAVTQEGRPFVRLVAAAFDSYLAANKSRHSAAV